MFKIKEDIGCQRQNPIKSIIAHINDYINHKAANQMTTSMDYDKAQVAHDLKHYGYGTVGEYARSRTNIFKVLFTSERSY